MKKVRRFSPLTQGIALSMIAGLLIWAKLRLVTNFPRVVQAEPEMQLEKGSAVTPDSNRTNPRVEAVPEAGDTPERPNTSD